MEPGPTVFVIPRYLEVRSRYLRRVALAFTLVEPVAFWIPMLAEARARWVVIIGGIILVGALAALQLPALGAPRTMRRRYRRITGQASLAAAAIFALQAANLVVIPRLRWLILGSIVFNFLLLCLLLITAPVYIAPRQEDVSRGVS